jgi:hypothetical protein
MIEEKITESEIELEIEEMEQMETPGVVLGD